MADEKLNVSPEENPQPSLFDAGPAGAPAQDAPTPEPPAPENAPEQTGGEPPAQDAPAGAPVPTSRQNVPKQGRKGRHGKGQGRGPRRSCAGTAAPAP